MLRFQIKIRPGESIVDQIVHAAIRAILSGKLKAGEAFPSVRTLAVELEAHPNTVQKAVQRLITEGWLEMRPGIGAFVGEPPQARPGDGARLLELDVGKLAVDARRAGLDFDEVVAALRAQWDTLEGGES